MVGSCQPRWVVAGLFFTFSRKWALGARGARWVPVGGRVMPGDWSYGLVAWFATVTCAASRRGCPAHLSNEPHFQVLLRGPATHGARTAHTRRRLRDRPRLTFRYNCSLPASVVPAFSRSGGGLGGVKVPPSTLALSRAIPCTQRTPSAHNEHPRPFPRVNTYRLKIATRLCY